MTENRTDQPSDPWPTAGPIPPLSTDWRAARANARAQRRDQRRAGRSNPGLFFGVFLVLIGAASLVGLFVPAFNTGVIWALVLIAIGALALTRAFGR